MAPPAGLAPKTAPTSPEVSRIAAILGGRLEELLDRIVARVTREVPEYAAPGVWAGYRENLRAPAEMIVQGMWIEGRALSVEDEEKVIALGAMRAEQGVALTSITRSLRLANEVGLDLILGIVKEMAGTPEDTRPLLGAVELMRPQLFGFIGRFEELMVEGYARVVSAAAAQVSAADANLLAELVGRLRGHEPELAKVMAQAAWERRVYEPYMDRPGLRREMEQVVAEGVKRFLVTLEQKRRLNPEERLELGLLLSSGVHAMIPVELLEEGMRASTSAGVILVVFRHLGAIDRERVVTPLAITLQIFTHDLVAGAREARETEVTWKRLGQGLWLDSDAGKVRGRDGGSVTLTGRELDILLRLATGRETFLSATQLGHLLGSPGGHPVDPRAVTQAICRLRRKLQQLSGANRVIVLRHRMGYALDRSS